MQATPRNVSEIMRAGSAKQMSIITLHFRLSRGGKNETEHSLANGN